jgi:hypothetical protein
MSSSRITAHKNSFPSSTNSSLSSLSSSSHSHSPPSLLDYTVAQKPAGSSIIKTGDDISWMCYGTVAKINPKTGELYPPPFVCTLKHTHPLNLASIEDLASHRDDTLMMCPENCGTVMLKKDKQSHVNHLASIHPKLAEKFAGVSLQSIKDSLEISTNVSPEERELALNTEANKQLFSILIKKKLYSTSSGWSLELPQSSAHKFSQPSYTVIRESSVAVTPKSYLKREAPASAPSPDPTPAPVPVHLASNPDYVPPTGKWQPIPSVKPATISTRGSKRPSPARGGKSLPPSQRGSVFSALRIEEEEEDDLSMESVRVALDEVSSKNQVGISKTFVLRAPPNGVTVESICMEFGCDGTAITHIGDKKFSCPLNHTLERNIKPNEQLPSKYCPKDIFWGPPDMRQNCNDSACTFDHKTGREAFIKRQINFARNSIKVTTKNSVTPSLANSLSAPPDSPPLLQSEASPPLLQSEASPPSLLRSVSVAPSPPPVSPPPASPPPASPPSSPPPLRRSGQPRVSLRSVSLDGSGSPPGLRRSVSVAPTPPPASPPSSPPPLRRSGQPSVTVASLRSVSLDGSGSPPAMQRSVSAEEPVLRTVTCGTLGSTVTRRITFTSQPPLREDPPPSPPEDPSPMDEDEAGDSEPDWSSEEEEEPEDDDTRWRREVVMEDSRMADREHDRDCGDR